LAGAWRVVFADIREFDVDGLADLRSVEARQQHLKQDELQETLPAM